MNAKTMTVFDIQPGPGANSTIAATALLNGDNRLDIISIRLQHMERSPTGEAVIRCGISETSRVFGEHRYQIINWKVESCLLAYVLQRFNTCGLDCHSSGADGLRCHFSLGKKSFRKRAAGLLKEFEISFGIRDALWLKTLRIYSELYAVRGHKRRLVSEGHVFLVEEHLVPSDMLP